MKTDHGLFPALRQKLAQIPQLTSVKIYLLQPPQHHYPMIILQPEQIRAAYGKKRIFFSGEISVAATQQAILSFYGQLMAVAFEGGPLMLEDQTQASIRFIEHTFTPIDKHGICALKQSFAALIH